MMCNNLLTTLFSVDFSLSNFTKSNPYKPATEKKEKILCKSLTFQIAH